VITSINYNYIHVVKIFGWLVDVEIINRKIIKESQGNIKMSRLQDQVAFEQILNTILKDLAKIGENEILYLMRKILSAK